MVSVNIHDLFSTVSSLHQNADGAHNFKHVQQVVAHVRAAIKVQDPPLDKLSRSALILAAYLHEVDDEKLNFTIEGVEKKEEDYPLARFILNRDVVSNDKQRLVDLTIEIISLVSCRKNRNHQVDEQDRWKLIVRDADRAEAIGQVGIARCYTYTNETEMPLFTPQTPRCQSIEELAIIASPELYQNYKGVSRSMIDHFYDKLLHIGCVQSGNRYLIGLLEGKYKIMTDFIIDFGVKGEVDISYLEELRNAYCT